MPTDAALRKFESENARHEKALGKIMGDDFAHFAACAQCDGVGYVPESTNQALPFERDPQTEPCETCAGFGTTLTGAREPGMVTRACSRCQGSGWTTVAEQPAVQPFVTLAPVDNGAPAPVLAEAAPVDPAVAELRARGYVVVEPIVSAPAPVT
jgi:hypothetical protein